MKLPFTTEEFLRVFERYNLAVWPMQYIFILMAVAAIILAVRKSAYSVKLITIFLSIFCLWMGAVYHISFFTSINKAAYVFGTIFILQGALFLFAGILKNQLSCQFKNNIYGIAGAILMVFALLIYPLIGNRLGHIYPFSPTFGLPCPTTIFTFGMLLWADRKIPVYLFIIPLLWSAIGFSASFSLGMKEDVSLLISGIITVSLILIKYKREKEDKIRIADVEKSKDRLY